MNNIHLLKLLVKLLLFIIYYSFIIIFVYLGPTSCEN